MNRKCIILIISILSTALLWNCNRPEKPEQTLSKPVVYDSGTLVLKHDDEIMMLQQFQIDSNRIHTRTLWVAGMKSMADCKGFLDTKGLPEELELNTYRPTDSGTWNPENTVRLNVSGGAVTVNAGNGEQIINDTAALNPFIVVMEKDTCFSPFPFSGFFKMDFMSDTLAVNRITLPGPQEFIVNKNGSGKFQPVENPGQVILFLNRQGRLDSLRGELALSGLTGRVYRNFDFDSAEAAIISEKVKSSLIPAVPVDSVVFANGDLNVKIRYSRPSMHGRKIFGYVVPFHKIWTVGADTAAEFSLNQPVNFYGQRLDTGNYSLLAIPRPNLWVLVINKKTGITDSTYNEADDIIQVPMKIDTLGNTVKMLTINIEPFDTGGLLTIEWENTGASIIFK